MAIIRRLLYGYLSQSTDPYNISIPWTTSDQDGMFKMNYSLEKAVHDNLVVWANTNWGERPMRFRFGLDVHRFLFDPIPIMKENILMNAKDQLSKFFSFLQIDRLEVLSTDDDETLPENSVLFVLEAHFKDNETKKVSVTQQIGV